MVADQQVLEFCTITFNDILHVGQRPTLARDNFIATNARIFTNDRIKYLFVHSWQFYSNLYLPRSFNVE